MALMQCMLARTRHGSWRAQGPCAQEQQSGLADGADWTVAIAHLTHAWLTARYCDSTLWVRLVSRTADSGASASAAASSHCPPPPSAASPASDS